MYMIMSETFIKIDSLQHLEISRQTYPTNRSKICAKFFQINADKTYIHDQYISVWVFSMFYIQKMR